MKRLTALLLALIAVSAFLLPALAAVEEEHPAYSEADAVLLARLITKEARGEPYEGQLAVGNVVLNRVAANKRYFGRGLRGVIYRRNQFAKPAKKYTASAYEAAVAALCGERVVPEYVLFFRRSDKPWRYGARWGRIGNHTFFGNPPEEDGYD